MKDQHIQLITYALEYGCNHKFGDGDVSNLFKDALAAFKLEVERNIAKNLKRRNK